MMAFEALADVIDAIAVLTQDSAQPGRPGDLVNREERAKLAATLLGAAHSVRGCFDEGSLDAPAARESARSLLGSLVKTSTSGRASTARLSCGPASGDSS